MNYTSNVHGMYEDDRDCPACGGTETVHVEGDYYEATGNCNVCDSLLTVNHDEELYYDAAESAGDYERDER